MPIDFDAIVAQISEDRARLYDRNFLMDGGVSLHLELARRISENMLALERMQPRKEVIPSQAV